MDKLLLLIMSLVLIMLTIETGKALNVDTKSNIYKIVSGVR
jgi:hypothetical protein